MSEPTSAEPNMVFCHNSTRAIKNRTIGYSRSGIHRTAITAETIITLPNIAVAVVGLKTSPHAVNGVKYEPKATTAATNAPHNTSATRNRPLLLSTAQHHVAVGGGKRRPGQCPIPRGHHSPCIVVKHSHSHDANPCVLPP